MLPATPVLKRGSRGTEQLTYLLWVTQLVCGRGQIPTQAGWLFTGTTGRYKGREVGNERYIEY